ncbi:hypothetical protein [Oceanobacillus saliphilus]|uniref:hypothetical protein n=1 Tax=Oceanobacillus saliphilus TaxID=2925834 RepID=UPI00201D5AEB|nr:hypothetical protein [Oceanobacillus saliphilus]
MGKYLWTEERIYNQYLPRIIDYPEFPVGAILKDSANHFSSHAAYIYEGHRITFEKLNHKLVLFANALHITGRLLFER